MEWEVYADNPYRVFYEVRPKQGEGKDDLLRFLNDAWIPLLEAAEGCQYVEVADNFGPTHGVVLIELWRNREVHDRVAGRLWNVDKPDVLAELRRVSTFVGHWEGVVVQSTGSEEDAKP